MNAINASVQPNLGATAELLLKTAERLYAEQGLGVVSTRQIAREAGQKNHSAISYHFGGETALVEAILDYRMIPLDQKRQVQYDKLVQSGQLENIRELVQLIVQPLTEELLRDEHDSYYISLLAQLINRGHWQQYFVDHPSRTSVILAVTERLIRILTKTLDKEVAEFRLSMMGPQVVRTVADWDAARRSSELTFDDKSLKWQTNQLVDYLVGALHAPVSKTSAFNKEV